MGKDFVTVNEEKIYVEDWTLDLSSLGISDINEIKGLENLTNLKKLYLTNNPIQADETAFVYMGAQKVVRFCQDKRNGKKTPRKLSELEKSHSLTSDGERSIKQPSSVKKNKSEKKIDHSF